MRASTRRAPAVDYSITDWTMLSHQSHQCVRLCQCAARPMLEQASARSSTSLPYSAFKAASSFPRMRLPRAVSHNLPKHSQMNGPRAAFKSTPSRRAISQQSLLRLFRMTTTLSPDLGTYSCCTLGSPQDVAGAAVFLSSPASDYISGHVLVVDGGLLGANSNNSWI